jgi:hypothetical protein
MKLLDALRNRRPQPPAGEDDAPSTTGAEPPIRGYDKLDERQIGERLHQLSQVQLGEVEDYERAHLDRPQVLDKLRYLRVDEPLPGYDELSPEQICDALVGADSETVKAVRDYERKFGQRPQVMDEAMRVLATAQPSAKETAARDAQEARVRAGFDSRAKTVRDMPGGGSGG